MLSKVTAFSIWYSLCQVIGLLVVFLMLTWCVRYEGGIAWRWSQNERNLHPLMMTLGFIYIMSNSMMIFRVFQQFSKARLKMIHACLHIISFCCIVVGLIAIWDYHNNFGYPNLRSLHSWIGLTTVILFVLQWCYGFTVFLYPGASIHIRSHSMNPHIFLGCSVFLLAVMAAITGLFQESLWATSYNQQVFANILGLFILLYAAIVAYILTKSGFKRLDYHI